MLPNVDFVKTLINGVLLKIQNIKKTADLAVLTKPQSLSIAEKAVARNNIFAASADSVEIYTVYASYGGSKTAIKVDKEMSDIEAAVNRGARVRLKYVAYYYPYLGGTPGEYVYFGFGENTPVFEVVPGLTGEIYYPDFIWMRSGNQIVRLSVSGTTIKAEKY